VHSHQLLKVAIKDNMLKVDGRVIQMYTGSSIRYRVNFKILVITFKAIHGVGPEYIRDLIEIKPSDRYNLRSSIVPHYYCLYHL
jgi:hypothetical protein